MRRVYRIRVLRFFFSGLFVGSLVLAVALYGLGREVWVARVFANGPHDLFGHAWYLGYAFEHTRLVVQALTTLTLASLVYLARSIARTLSTALPHTYATN